MDSAAFEKGTEYEDLSATAFRDVVVALAQYEWIEAVPASYNAETGERRRTRVRPTRVMFDWLVKHDLVLPYHSHGQRTSVRHSKEGLLFVSISDGEGNKSSVTLDRPLAADQAVSKPLYEALSKQRLKCSFRDYRQYEDLYRFNHGQPRHRLTRIYTLRRVFTEEGGRAGRL